MKSQIDENFSRPFRIAEEKDVPLLAKIYKNAAEEIGKLKYSPLQVGAWSSFADETKNFADFILTAETIIYSENGEPVAFGGVRENGHLISLYVDAARSRKGIGGKILAKLIERSKERNIPYLFTEASEFSKPLFERHGFRLVEIENVTRRGAQFIRYKMRLDLSL